MLVIGACATAPRTGAGAGPARGGEASASAHAGIDAAARGDVPPAGSADPLAAPAAEGPRLATLTAEAIRFPTVAGNLEARRGFQAWVRQTAQALGLQTREAGKVTEVELAGPPGAPVLGLVVHGDVQPVEPSAWTEPPFTGLIRDGYVVGRGAADDKGPLVQALLAMSALRDEPRTQTIRLLVGSDEESGSSDMKEYLASHAPPAYSLVLDSAFPVVVGEKAWSALTVSAPVDPDIELSAGLAPSIVPDIARLKWPGAKLPAQAPDPGTRAELVNGALVVHGKSAHSGVNIEGGRNALVSLAHIATDLLPPSGARDLLAFARFAGQDLYGTSLDLTDDNALWGRFNVNVAVIKDGTLTINLRRPPPMTGPELKAHLEKVVEQFNERTGAHLKAGGYYADEPLVFDPQSRLVRRLMDDYERATGTREKPAISGGGTYAKRLPRAIAFGMWFPGKPYPGHDVDEKISIKDLERGYAVLLTTLRDLVLHEPLQDPFGK
jgi:predicted dipeptidase